MKNSLTLFSCFICLVVLALPVSLSADDASKSTFKIGVIAPLSGPLAEYGVGAKNGIEMARRHRPESFKNIELIYEDSQWDARTAVSAFNKLRVVDRASLILNWGNPTTEAVASIAEQTRTPLIGMTLDPVPSIGKKFVIRSTNSADQFSARLVEYLKSAGYKNMGVVMAQNTYVEGLYEGIEKSLADDQKIEVVDRYNMDDQDFRSSIAKIRGRNYDAIGVFLISGQIHGFYRQMASQNLTVPTFGTDFFESKTEILMSQGGMNGAVYSHLGTSDSFREEYVELHGNDLQIAYAANWYDMAMLLGDVFTNLSKTASAEDIMTSLRESGVRQGVGGEFQYRETPEDGPHFQFPIKVKKIEGEEIVEVL